VAVPPTPPPPPPPADDELLPAADPPLPAPNVVGTAPIKISKHLSTLTLLGLPLMDVLVTQSKKFFKGVVELLLLVLLWDVELLLLVLLWDVVLLPDELFFTADAVAVILPAVISAIAVTITTIANAPDLLFVFIGLTF
jgi:hypothetical protein